jgi:hypothetical protein
MNYLSVYFEIKRRVLVRNYFILFCFGKINWRIVALIAGGSQNPHSNQVLRGVSAGILHPGTSFLSIPDHFS